MVCMFPFVRAPCRAGGCGGWELTCQSSPLGQGQAVGFVPPAPGSPAHFDVGLGSPGSALTPPCLFCPHKQLDFKLNHRAVFSM